MFDRMDQLKFVMSVTMVRSKEDVLSVEAQEYPMRITAKNVFNLRKTEMDVRKLSIQVLLKQIYSMRGKNMDSRKSENSVLEERNNKQIIELSQKDK